MTPSHPIDDPKTLGLDRYVIAEWNGVKWPDGARAISYLSSKRQHPINGSALFFRHEDAETFATREDAEKFYAENNAKRSHPYTDGGRSPLVVTIRELRQMVGFRTEEGDA